MSAADLTGLAAGPPPGAPPSIMVGGDAPPGGPGGGMPPGLPPELAALIGGGDAPPDEAEGSDFPQDEVASLQDIRERMMHYMDIASDDIEKSDMAKLLAGVQKLLAQNQQQAEAASGVTPAHKGMAKAIQGRA